MEPTAAARLATAFRTAMKDQALSGSGLAERIERLTGTTPSPTWVSRRLGGGEPRKSLVTVDPDLFVIARALGINRSDLIELVIRAMFGDSAVDRPIPYELTGKCPDSGVGNHDCAEHVEVPAGPTEAEFAGLPVVDLGIVAQPEDRNTFAEHREHTDAGRTFPDCPYCTTAED